MAVYIPILKQSDLVLDNKKQIVPDAKIDIWDPVSSTPIDVYTYDAANDRYILAVNPIRLDVNSRPQSTYFVKQLALCRLSRFKGDFYDELSGSTVAAWEFIREWYGAFSEDDAKNDTIISGISSLADANTELGKVTVVGYWTDKDCEPRTYVWDPNCVQDADGGYIIKSNDHDTGRWILMFDDEYLPSTYYGVYPGHESTMNALLNYVTTVGTAQKPTAPGIYFVPGTYDASTVALLTNKKILLDADTQFTRQYIDCADLKVIGDTNHWICDFYVENPEAVVHSSWFRTLQIFYNCGAKKYIFDETNYFFDTTLKSNCVLNQKIIEGSTRMPTNYGNYALTLNNCQIEGQKIWDSTDKIVFQNTDFKDIWFKNPANIDFATKVNVSSMGINTVRLANFSNITAYVNYVGANGITVLDLAGRDISTLNVPASVTELRNVIAGTISCSKGSTADVTFRNVKANTVSLSCRYINLYDSDISFSSEPTFSAMWGHRSRINSSYPWYTKSKQIICEDCYIGFGINMVTDNTSDHGVLEFTNCEFQTNVSLSVKRITMKRCVTSNNTIKVYPRKSDSTYYIGPATFENCVLNNNNPLEFTKNENDDNCYECIAQWTLVGNTFEGNTEGVRCRYWQNRVGSNYGKTFIALGPSVNAIEIKGNTGKCPAEDFYGSVITCPWNEDHNYWPRWPSTSEIYYSPTFSKRVFVGGYGANTERLCKLPDKAYIYGITHNATSPGEIVSMHNAFIVHSEVLENIQNGDFFKVNVAFLRSPGEHDNYARYVTHIE